MYHPDYSIDQANWELWRDVYASGTKFLDKYLERFSSREDNISFNRRKKIAYVPAFAKAALNDVKNSIYQRLSDVSRYGGSEAFHRACDGELNGVDLLGSTMDFFIGQQILLELLIVKRVGIYIDMPQIEGLTKNDVANKHPYIYYYPVEDIINWTYDNTDSPNQFLRLKLRDRDFELDEEGFPKNRVERYRTIYINDSTNLVNVKFTDKANNQIGEIIELEIDRIPFLMPTITHSLLEDVASYQIALANLESSDIIYSLLANFPFYVEQYDYRAVSPYLDNQTNEPVNLSMTEGRRYPLGLEAPRFIHPSPEPMKATMEKEERLKEDIKLLVNLSVASLGRNRNDDEGRDPLEAGLSYLGMILQDTENRIADFWALYEGNIDSAKITYPTNYSLPNSEDNREEVKHYIQLVNTVNSPTFRREISKQIVRKTLGNRVPVVTLLTINEEIDSAKVLIADPDTIRADIEAGIVSTETASLARGYPKGEVDQAKIDHEERLIRIQSAQTPNPAARGLRDLAVDVNDSKIEKQQSQNVDLQADFVKPVRGEAK